MAPRSVDRGMAIPLVMGVILVLGTFGAVLRIFSQSAYREVDLVNAHLRAVAVGEIAFSTITSRLSNRPWSQRWFASGPEVRHDVAVAGGSYSYLIRDVLAPAGDPNLLSGNTLGSRNQADLLVRAVHGRSVVVLFWRLTMPDRSLDYFTRILPTFFTFGPEDGSVSAPTADALSTLVNAAIEERDQNKPLFGTVIGPLQGATTASAVGNALGVGADPSRPPLEVAAGTGGGSGVTNETHNTAANQTLNLGFEVPVPPPPPPGTPSESDVPTGPSPGAPPSQGQLVEYYQTDLRPNLMCIHSRWGGRQPPGLGIAAYGAARELDRAFASVPTSSLETATSGQRGWVAAALQIIGTASGQVGGITEFCK